MGVLCALSAAVQTARLNAAVTNLGVQNELDVIAAAVIGGTSFAGGIGTIPGAVLGAVVMQSLRSGMVLLQHRLAVAGHRGRRRAGHRGRHRLVRSGVGRTDERDGALTAGHRRPSSSRPDGLSRRTATTTDADHRRPAAGTDVPLVELRDIRVAFGGVHAVDGVTIDLYPGEVVGLVGGNGAGKSTLIHTLSGAHPADSGEILINGQPVTIHNPRDAKALRDRDDLPEAGAGRQHRRRRQRVPRPRAARPAPARSTTRRWQSATRKVMEPAEPAVQEPQDRR